VSSFLDRLPDFFNVNFAVRRLSCPVDHFNVPQVKIRHLHEITVINNL
jgi:hypothetical protein